MASGTLKVRLVSPSETVFQGEAVSVVLPVYDGKVGILPGHAPYMALLGGGTLEIDVAGSGRIDTFFVNRGVVKVQNDEVTILTEYAGETAPEGFQAKDAWLDPAELEEVSYPGNPLV
jgi:F-type H+-transporting ATPase subunit epsilon